MVAAGLLARNAVARGLATKPWVKTSLAPGLARRDRLPRGGGPDGSAREAPLPPRRLRLHDLHRQLRTAGRAGRRGDRGATTSPRSPCCRGTGTSRAASIRWRAPATSPRRRSWWPSRSPGGSTSTSPREPLGTDADGVPGHARRTSGRAPDEVARVVARGGERRGLHAQLRIGLRRRRPLARPAGSGRRPVRLGPGLDLRGAPAVLRRARATPRRAGGHHGARALAVLGDSVTTDHICPGRLDRAHLAGGGVARRAWRRAAGLQLVRLAPRASRGDDARHVREHPAAQPAHARCRGQRDRAPAERRADEHLRRGDALRGRGHAARHPGRQGVRLGLVARLGGQGPHAPGRAGRDRRVVRADPSVEPGRHGHPAAPVRCPDSHVASLGLTGRETFDVVGTRRRAGPRMRGDGDRTRRRRSRDPLPRGRPARRRDRRHLPSQRRGAPDGAAPARAPT